MKNFLPNMLATIKNGQLSKRSFVICQKKKICEALLKILWSEGFILGYSIENQKLKIFLKYVNSTPAINTLSLISTPSKKIYYSVKQIWKIKSANHFIIFSTNQGLKSINDCKKLKIGGEPILALN